MESSEIKYIIAMRYKYPRKSEKQPKKGICMKNFNHTYLLIYLLLSMALKKAIMFFFPEKHMRDSVIFST